MMQLVMMLLPEGETYITDAPEGTVYTSEQITFDQLHDQAYLREVGAHQATAIYRHAQQKAQE